MNPEKETKQKIMDAAFELFSTSSYDKVSIEEIIKKAGVSKGGLFHHFKSKYDLAIGTTLNKTEELWMQPVLEIKKIKDPYKRIRIFIDSSIDILFENKKLIKFLLDIHEESMKRGEEARLWMQYFYQYTEIMTKMFEDCKIPNPQVKAMILFSSLDAVGLEAAHFPDLERSLDLDLLKNEFY
ncbi:MAG: TetR/AcrR family transcriptional regulator, partial [Candidatus Thorarchaeota archaeon]